MVACDRNMVVVVFLIFHSHQWPETFVGTDHYHTFPLLFFAGTAAPLLLHGPPPCPSFGAAHSAARGEALPSAPAAPPWVLHRSTPARKLGRSRSHSGIYTVTIIMLLQCKRYYLLFAFVWATLTFFNWFTCCHHHQWPRGIYKAVRPLRSRLLLFPGRPTVLVDYPFLHQLGSEC